MVADIAEDWKLIQRWAGATPVDGDPGQITADAIIAKAGLCRNAAPPVRDLTSAIVLEIVEHEGIVTEAYKDSAGVWTWGVGVTNDSGHRVYPRYKDKPQTVAKCLEIYLWLLREEYLPDVLRAFGDRPLAEHELGAALSFHWNTGAITRAEWVKQVCAGDDEKARVSIMNWRSPPEIISRRKAERDLFFNGTWTSDGKVPVYRVAKPGYQPRGAQLIDVRPELAELMT